MNLEKVVSELSNEALKLAFGEIEEFRKTGVLSSGVVRGVYDEHCDKLDIPVRVVEQCFLFEMAKRHYRNHLV